MSERNLNMKRVRDTTLWLFLFVTIVTTLFFAVHRKANAAVAELKIEIVGLEEDENLITEKEVTEILQLAAGKVIDQSNIKDLDIRDMEEKLNKDNRIKQADLYFDSNDNLRVKVIQKKPIMRVIETTGKAYFLDYDGNQVPVAKGSAIRTAIATGIREEYDQEALFSEKPSKLKEVFMVMRYISKDNFLAALIEQIGVENNKEQDIVLIPKVGREKIIFGNADNIEAKFDNLKIFYKDGMPKLGWSRYKSLNLKYSEQVRGILANPATAENIRPVTRDSLTAELATNKKSIQ